MNPKELADYNRARLYQERKAAQAERDEQREQQPRQSKETEDEAYDRATSLFQILWDKFAPIWKGVPLSLEVPMRITDDGREIFYSNAVMDLIVGGFKNEGYTCKSEWQDRLDENDQRIRQLDKDGNPASKDGKPLFEKVRCLRISA